MNLKMLQGPVHSKHTQDPCLNQLSSVVAADYTAERTPHKTARLLTFGSKLPMPSIKCVLVFYLHNQQILAVHQHTDSIHDPMQL
jgi:hypothetical protein